ncbi:MAG TPA: hypothetical protein VG916_13060 [Gemmatimonadaceae bacterium]|nr:hypothetical protein [Gemmatimonadaceae bacterium]
MGVGPARLLGTLRVLLFEPGRLSAESAAGTRGGHALGPVTLFVLCSAAFFVSVPVARLVDPDAPSIHVRTAADSAVMMLADSAAFVGAPEVRENLVVRAVGAGRAWTLFTHQAVLEDIVANAVPRAALLLLPLFALLTFLAWRGSGAGFGAHLTFALDVHSACFAALLVPALLQPLHSTAVGVLGSLGVLVYTTWYVIAAGRRALGGTAREVNLRMTVVGVLYAPVALAVTLGLALAAVRSL